MLLAQAAHLVFADAQGAGDVAQSAGGGFSRRMSRIVPASLASRLDLTSLLYTRSPMALMSPNSCSLA